MQADPFLAEALRLRSLELRQGQVSIVAQYGRLSCAHSRDCPIKHWLSLHEPSRLTQLRLLGCLWMLLQMLWLLGLMLLQQLGLLACGGKRRRGGGNDFHLSKDQTRLL